MENKILEEILKFISENQVKYFSFLSKLNSFPSICDYSSYILGAYLTHQFDIPSDYMEGAYEDDDDSHCWLEIKGHIIDFTLCQFTGKKIPMKTRCKMSEQELFQMYIIERGLPVVITPEDELMDNYIEGYDTSIPDEYLIIARESKSFNDYLERINKNKLKLSLQ